MLALIKKAAAGELRDRQRAGLPRQGRAASQRQEPEEGQHQERVRPEPQAVRPEQAAAQRRELGEDRHPERVRPEPQAIHPEQAAGQHQEQEPQEPQAVRQEREEGRSPRQEPAIHREPGASRQHQELRELRAVQEQGSLAPPGQAQQQEQPQALLW